MNGIALIAGMIIAGIALLAVLGTVIAVVIVRLLVKGSPPEEVLRQRYAQGETTRDQYEQMRQDLETNATGSASDLRAPSRSVIWLSSLVAVLALLSTIVGLFSQGGPGEFAFRTVRGETVQMYGHGIYRYDTLFQAAINRGTDAVTLVLGIPLLVVSVLLYRGGSLRGRLLLTSALHFLADGLPDDRVHLARPPASRAVPESLHASCLEPLDPGPHRGLVALEDGGDLGDGVVPTGEQDHADALTHPTHFPAGQALQALLILLLKRPHKDHRGCSPPAQSP
jgi:hypothetical protein